MKTIYWWYATTACAALGIVVEVIQNGFTAALIPRVNWLTCGGMLIFYELRDEARKQS